MRAVGYVAPHLSAAATTDDQDAPEPVSWSAVVEPSAGSWGAAETGRLSAETLSDDPAERIVNHCQAGGHNLVAIFGVAGGGSDDLMEQLGLPPHQSQDDATTDSPTDDAQFRDLLASLTPPAGHPALVLIHDATHLASDVETLINRLLQIRNTGSDAQCTDPDAPDPLLSGISLLPLTAEDAASADEAGVGDDEDAADHTTADTDAAEIEDADGRGGVPKVIELASSGRVLGRTPYGYRSGAQGTLEPVQHEAQVVRRVFGWYTGRGDGRGDDAGNRNDGGGGRGNDAGGRDDGGDGRGDDAGNRDDGGDRRGKDAGGRDGGDGARDAAPIGMRMIVQRLQDDGVPTRTGRPWSTAAISLMLKNKAYVGTYERYGFLVAGNHEPLIDRALFNAAQRRLPKRQVSAVPALADPATDADSAFLLGGLVRCANCGHGIPGLSRKRTWRRQDDTVASKVYRYYEFAECPQRRKSRGTTRAAADIVCPSWRADRLEELVTKRIASMPASELDDITPRDADVDIESQFHEARRNFAAAVQRTAAGKGDIEHLRPELDALSDTRDRLRERASAQSRDRQPRARLRRLVRDHVANLAADVDWQTSRDAVYALVGHVAITNDDATVNLHSN